MEREKRIIFLYRTASTKRVKAAPLIAFEGLTQHLRNIAARANRRYVDNLTKKQQAALAMIDMLDEGQVVEGVGYWINSYYYGYPTKRYVLDC